MREFIIWNYNLTLNLIPDKKVEAISQIYKTLTIKTKEKLILYFFYISLSALRFKCFKKEEESKKLGFVTRNNFYRKYVYVRK